MIDQLLFSKSNLSDIFVQLSTGSNNSNNFFKDNDFKDKINFSLEKLDNLNDLRSNIVKSVKYLEQMSAKFYDDAKIIFKNLKNLHITQTKLSPSGNSNSLNRKTDSNGFSKRSQSNSQRIESKIPRSNSNLSKIDPVVKNLNEEKNNLIAKVNGVKRQNEELLLELNSLRQNYSKLFNENINLKNEIDKKNLVIGDIKNVNLKPVLLHKVQSQFNSNSSNVDLSKEGFNEKKTSSTRDHYSNTFSERLKLNNLNSNSKINENSSEEIKNLNASINTSFTKNFLRLIEMVLNFLQQMSNLQKSITNKIANIKELKLDFEKKKKELIEFSNFCYKNLKNEQNIQSNEDQFININNDSVPREVVIKIPEVLTKSANDSVPRELVIRTPEVLKNSANVEDIRYAEDNIINENNANIQDIDKPEKPSSKNRKSTCNTDELINEISSLKKKLNDLKQVNDNLIDKNNETSSILNEKINQLLLEKENLSKDIDSFTLFKNEHNFTILDLSDKLKIFEKENSSLNTRNIELNNSNAILTKDMNQIRETLKNQQNENSQLIGEIKNLNENINSLGEKNNSLTKEKDQSIKKKRELEDEIIKLKEINYELEKAKNMKEKSNNSIINEMEKILKQYQSEIQLNKENEDKIQSLDLLVKSLNDELSQCKNELSTEINEKKENFKKCDNHNKTIQSLKGINDESKQMNLLINNMNSDLKQKNIELEEKLNINTKVLVNSEATLNQLKNENNKLSEKNSILIEKQNYLSKELELKVIETSNLNLTLEGNFKVIKGLEMEITSLMEKVVNLNEVIDELNITQSKLKHQIQNDQIKIEKLEKKNLDSMTTLYFKIKELEGNLKLKNEEIIILINEKENKYLDISQKKEKEVNLIQNLKITEEKLNNLQTIYNELQENYQTKGKFLYN